MIKLNFLTKYPNPNIQNQILIHKYLPRNVASAQKNKIGDKDLIEEKGLATVEKKVEGTKCGQ